MIISDHCIKPKNPCCITILFTLKTELHYKNEFVTQIVGSERRDVNESYLLVVQVLLDYKY